MSNKVVSFAGEPITFELEGIEEFQHDMDTLAESLRTQTSFDMLTDVGYAVQGWMQDNVRQKLYRHSTGALAASISAVVLQNEEGAACFVGPNDAALPYTMIHEYGGHIYPKRAKMLHWYADGQEHWAKHVYIPARPYIRPAFEDHQEEIMEIMREDLDYAIAAGCANL